MIEKLTCPVDIVKNLGQYALYIIFGEPKEDHPVSANITYYGSPANLED